MKKLLKNSIIITLLVSMFAVYIPTPVHAQGVVTDPGNTAVNTGTMINTIKNIVKEFSLDIVAQRIASSLLNSMVDSTTNWVNNGFQGNPLFVDNWEDFALGLANVTATAVLTEVSDATSQASSRQLNSLLERATEACQATPQQIQISGGSPSLSWQGSNPTPTPTAPGAGTGLTSNTSPNLATSTGGTQIACTCKTQIEARLDAEGTLASMTPEELSAFLASKSRVTAEEYLDTDYPTDQCDKFREQTGERDNILLSGGYGRDVIKFLGYAYGGTQNGTATLYMPNFSSLPQDIAGQVANNWKRFGTDFKAGGWTAWDQATSLNNTPLGIQLIASNNVNQQIARQVGNTAAEIQQNSGFLGVRRCKTTQQISLTSGDVCPPGQEEVVTPGAVVGDQLSQALGAPMRKNEAIDGWGDILSSALVRLATNLTNVGVSKLSNSIGRQMDIASGKYAGVGGNILATTQYGVAGGANADAADEVVDLEGFFYGDPIPKQARGANGQPLFEPLLDANGQQVVRNGVPLFDNTRPIYEYEALYEFSPTGQQVLLRDQDGNIQYDMTRPVYQQDTQPAVGVYPNVGFEYDQTTGEIVRGTTPAVDVNGQPLRMRRGGALARTRLMTFMLSQQQTSLKDMPKYMLDLDRCLPGPDMGWQGRLQERYDGITQQFFDDKPLVAALKEIGQATYSIILDNESGAELTRNRCASPASAYQSIYNLSGNSNNHLDCYMTSGGEGTPQRSVYKMVEGQNLAAYGKNFNNIPSADEIRDLLSGAKSRYARKYNDIQNRLDESRSLLRKLTQMEELYRQYLANPAANQTVPGDLARQVVAIREDVPFTTMIDREKSFLDQLKEDQFSATQLLDKCITEKADPTYLDIMIKDEMKVLYCPLQFHGQFNTMTTQEKVDFLGFASPDGVESLINPGSITGAVLASAAGPVGILYVGLLGGSLFNQFQESPAERYEGVFSQIDPNIGDNSARDGEFMCFETNVITESDPAETQFQCWGQGASGDSGNEEGTDNSVQARVERLKIWCKDFYTANYSDYTEALGIGSKY